ncbi:MAG: class I SAM-dependent methyltransferase [Gemmatimonadetes bacterium]|nr:class I SAM-dependent methyltransferase [Gemmatimonadota bacterium]
MRPVRRPRMNQGDALALLRAAVPAADGEVWADLGAGTGVFTRALATLVGPPGRVIAVDRDATALEVLSARTVDGGPAAPIITVAGDVTEPLSLPPLDGVVMANVLHFVADAEGVLARVAAMLRPGGRLVLMEYEGRRPGPWVPYPVDAARFVELARDAGFTLPRVVAAQPSRFGGEIYVAVAERSP